MTPDESAWTQFAAATLPRATDHNPAADAARVAAECADALFAELRRRRESGAFGPQHNHASADPADCAVCVANDPDLGDGARAEMAERERDNLQSLLNAARVEAERATARADVAFRERDEQCARAEVAEAQMREAEAVAFTHMNMRGNADVEMRNTAKRVGAAERDRDEVRAELLSMTESRDAIRTERDVAHALLKEALGALRAYMAASEVTLRTGRPAQGGEQRGNTLDIEAADHRAAGVLSKAKAAGYGP